VFDFWVTTGPFSTLISCIAVFVLACGYEWYRENRSRLDRLLIGADTSGAQLKALGGEGGTESNGVSSGVQHAEDDASLLDDGLPTYSRARRAG
jgi:hypothetical protein